MLKVCALSTLRLWDRYSVSSPKLIHITYRVSHCPGWPTCMNIVNLLFRNYFTQWTWRANEHMAIYIIQKEDAKDELCTIYGGCTCPRILQRRSAFSSWIIVDILPPKWNPIKFVFECPPNPTRRKRERKNLSTYKNKSKEFTRYGGYVDVWGYSGDLNL